MNASLPVTNRSIGVTTSAQTAAAANTARRGWKIKNDSDTDVWVNFVATATAAAGSGNFKIVANGGYFASEPNMVERGAMSIIHAGTGTKNVTIYEF